MELLKSWILAVTAVAILSAAAMSLCPRGAVKRVVRLICGLLMLLVVLRPAAELLGGEGLPDLDGLRLQAQRSTQQAQADAGEILESVIAEQTASYIVDKAAGLGADCRAQVRCRAEENGLLLPYEVEVSGALTDNQRAQLTALLEEELDIPAQRQTYLGGSEE